MLTGTDRATFIEAFQVNIGWGKEGEDLKSIASKLKVRSYRYGRLDVNVKAAVLLWGVET